MQTSIKRTPLLFRRTMMQKGGAYNRASMVHILYNYIMDCHTCINYNDGLDKSGKTVLLCDTCEQLCKNRPYSIMLILYNRSQNNYVGRGLHTILDASIIHTYNYGCVCECVHLCVHVCVLCDQTHGKYCGLWEKHKPITAGPGQASE